MSVFASNFPTEPMGVIYFCRTRLEKLPLELLLEIAGHLDIKSCLKLAATNRYLHQAADFRRALPRAEMQDQLCAIEYGSQEMAARDLCFCHHCYRPLPRARFPRSTNRRSWWLRPDRHADRAKARRCFDCAAKTRHYPHLRPRTNGQRPYYCCHNCGEYQNESTRCRGRLVRQGMSAAEAAQQRDLCTPKPAQKSRFITLPTPILRRIAKSLEYLDTLRLAQTCQLLHRHIEPNEWHPLHERYRFLQHRGEALGAAGPWEGERRPCFTCFRLLPEARFTQEQLVTARQNPQTAYKLRCNACLERMHRSRTNSVKAGWFRRVACDTCVCLKLVGRTCLRCVELYESGVVAEPPEGWPPAPPEAEPDYQEALLELDHVFDDDEENLCRPLQREYVPPVPYVDRGLSPDVQPLYLWVLFEDAASVKERALEMYLEDGAQVWAGGGRGRDGVNSMRNRVVT